MNRIKAFAIKIWSFIKARKGYCILAAALIVLLTIAVCNLDIETADQHNARKRDETKKRQELIEKLEGSVSGQNEDGNLDDGAVSREAVSEKEAGDALLSNAVSGQGSITTDVSDTTSGNGAGQTTEPLSETQNDTGQTSDGDSSQGQGSSTAASSGTQTSGQGSVSQAGNTSGNQNQSQSTGQSQSGNQNQSQSTGQSQSGNQNQSQSTGQNPSGGNASTSEEEQYIMVTVKIICDSVIGNPDLTTSAGIPSDGRMLEAKTAVKKGQTVYDALKAVCTDHGITYTKSGPDSSPYIQSIGGLAEKECGRYSGWKYKVNDIVPGKSCGAYVLNNNDVIEWYYATSVTQ